MEQKSRSTWLEALKNRDQSFSKLPEFESKAAGMERLAEVLTAAAGRLQDNYPYFHPLYAGQMLKPPHPLARLAYAPAMWIKPNNPPLHCGRATSATDEEA